MPLPAAASAATALGLAAAIPLSRRLAWIRYAAAVALVVRLPGRLIVRRCLRRSGRRSAGERAHLLRPAPDSRATPALTPPAAGRLAAARGAQGRPWLATVVRGTLRCPAGTRSSKSSAAGRAAHCWRTSGTPWHGGWQRGFAPARLAVNHELAHGFPSRCAAATRHTTARHCVSGRLGQCLEQPQGDQEA
jgi:hypothetical protein